MKIDTPCIKATDLGAKANVGDKVHFNNGLVESDGVVITVSSNDAFAKANGEKFRYIIELPSGHTQLCSGSEMTVL